MTDEKPPRKPGGRPPGKRPPKSESEKKRTGPSAVRRVTRKPRNPDKPPMGKEQIFVAEYVRTRSITAAAKVAWPNLAAQDASRYGFYKLQQPGIKKVIDEQIAMVAHEARVDSVEVVREVARIALFNPRRIVDEGGAPRSLADLPDDVAAGVSSIKFHRDGALEYKFWDKNSALEKLMKYLGLFEKDNKQQAANAVAAALNLIDGRSTDLVAQQGSALLEDRSQ